MQLSFNWLQDYIDLTGLSAVDVAKTLTDIGLEVEALTPVSAFTDAVVVGKVLNAIPHPNADTLRLCQVDIGANEPLQIVCGAPNARAGIHVAVATVGATLPGDFKIKKSKIRGELSCGMLCSGRELGISDEHSGIIELPNSAPVGASVGATLGLADTIIAIGITPNRGDCLSYIGVARDLAAKLKRVLKEPAITHKTTATLSSQAKIKVQIATEHCSRFVALCIKNVQVTPSPAWLQKRLEASGMRPINLLVDVTNYVMLEYGQPLHAYDERDVRDGIISVREARDGETLVTLDGQTRALVAGDLLICDGHGPIGLAGVMGGQNSEVKADTTAIIVEVAAFSATAVRQTARRLDIHSEASHRFERGINIEQLPKSAQRVAELLATVQSQVQIASTHVDAYPTPISRRVVTLRLSRTRELLGTPHLTRAELCESLEALAFLKLDSNDDRFVFEIPAWRNDIEREVDLIEEVARLRGYDKITAQMPVMSIKSTPEDPFIDFIDDARVLMAGAGFNETITFPFISAKEMAALAVPATHPFYPSLSLANPLSDEHSLLQVTLIPGLLRALNGNRRQGVHGIRLFECGRGYIHGHTTIDATLFPQLQTLNKHGRHLTRRAKAESARPFERHVVAAVFDQPFVAKSWNTAATPVDFFHGKAAVQGLLNALAINQVQFSTINNQELPFLHPGAAAQVLVNGKWVGFVGALHPQCATAFDLAGSPGNDHAPVILELDLEILFNARALSRRIDPMQRRFPALNRDLALLLDKSTTHQDVVTAIRGFKRKKYLQRYHLFDVYEGDKLAAGKKSLAYNFQFQSATGTLTDKDIEPEMAALVAWLTDTLGASQR